LLFRAESLHHIEHILRELDPISVLRIGQAMGSPPQGEDTKAEVIQNSENCRPWPVEDLTDLVGGRMRLLLNKSENCIIKIVLSGRSWTLVILDSLLACSKSRCPLLDSPKAHCILVITLFKFGEDLCARLPVKTIVLNHGSLLEQEGYS
jgi:hypothetical protein